MLVLNLKGVGISGCGKEGRERDELGRDGMYRGNTSLGGKSPG